MSAAGDAWAVVQLERIPASGMSATYDELRDGAATVLADGLLDPLAVRAAATAGWLALADALLSTDVRHAWEELRIDDRLCSFRDVGSAVVTRLLDQTRVSGSERWATLDDEATRALAATLRQYARRS